MSQTLVQSIVGTSSAAATTVTATFAAGATAGNLIVCAVGMDKSSGTQTPPSGFTQQFAQDSASVSSYLGIKVAAGGETAITFTRGTASTAGDTMWIEEWSDSGSGTWTILGSASDLTNETTRLVTPSGTTAATLAMGRGSAYFTIDSGQSNTGTLSYTNSYTNIRTYAASGRGDVAAANLADVAAGTAATTSQTHTPTADQTSGMIIVFAKVSAAGGGLGTARPGQVWRRRFHRPQQLLPLTPVVSLTGDVTATVTETDAVTAVVGAVGAVAVTVTSGSTVTAVVGVVGQVTATVTESDTVAAVMAAPGGARSVTPGRTWLRRFQHRQQIPPPSIIVAAGLTADVAATVTETDTVTAVVGAVGAVTATVTSGSTVTAVVGVVGAVSATVTCGSTVTASTVSGLIGTVSVTVTSGSTVTAVVGKIGTVSATVTSGSTFAAVTALFGSVSTTVTAGPTVTGAVGRFGAVTTTVTVGSTVTPFLLGAVIDVTGRVVVTQTVASTVDAGGQSSSVGITQTNASNVAGQAAAGGTTRVDPTTDGRTDVG